VNKSASDITSDPAAYDEKEVELLWQTFLAGSPPKLLIDGKSGINQYHHHDGRSQKYQRTLQANTLICKQEFPHYIEVQ
jgi:hypothetical protein